MANKNLKNQCFYAIETVFRERQNKNSLKKTEGSGNGRIFSYANRRDLISTSATFCNFIKTNYNIKQVKDIKIEHCIAFLESNKNISAATYNQYRSRIIKLAHIMNKVDKCKLDFTNLPSQKETKENRIRTNRMKEDDYNLIYSSFCDGDNTKKAMYLSKSLGLRVQECAKIKTSDIILNGELQSIADDRGNIIYTFYNFVKIIDSKGKRSRNVPIPDNLVQEFLKIKTLIGDNNRICSIRYESLNNNLYKHMEKIRIKKEV